MNAQYALGAIYFEYYGILRDYKKAKYWLKKAADKGDARAQALFGCMYQYGYGMDGKRDTQKAEYWLDKAAKQGNVQAMQCRIVEKGRSWTDAELIEATRASMEEMRLLHIKAEQGDILAQSMLGSAYIQTQFVKTDYKKAKYWYEQAAKQGHAIAMHRLGSLHRFDNKGIKKDIKKGMDYYEQAAKKNHVPSQFRLGRIYFDGDKGIIQDLSKAAHYYEQAARQGHVQAQYDIGAMYAEGKGVAKDWEKANYYIEKSGKDGGPYTTRKLYLWTKEKAEKGGAWEQYSLAQMYYYGEIGVPQDQKKARYWFKQAIKQEEEELLVSRAEANLAHMYMEGEGGEQDIQKAISLFEQADADGEPSAPYCLGHIYLKGIGIKQDSAKAKAYFERAAKRRDFDARYYIVWSWYELALMYELGKGSIQKDYKKAKEYYVQASNGNFASAQYNLGLMYAKGTGTDKDLEKSVYWFRTAAHQGYRVALQALSASLEKGIGVKKNVTHSYAYLVALLMLDPNDKDIQELQENLLKKYQLSPEQITEAKYFASEVRKDIEKQLSVNYIYYFNNK